MKTIKCIVDYNIINENGDVVCSSTLSYLSKYDDYDTFNIVSDISRDVVFVLNEDLNLDKNNYSVTMDIIPVTGGLNV